MTLSFLSEQAHQTHLHNQLYYFTQSIVFTQSAKKSTFDLEISL